MIRAYYSSPVSQFLNQSTMQILGELANHHNFDLEGSQKQAWIHQIELLKQVLIGIDGEVYFEFSIPRMGKRVDVILLSRGIIFAIEFKVGASSYAANDLDQVMDYALDLKNFHATSHSLPIVPILVATHAKAMPNSLVPYQDLVYLPLKVNAITLRDCLNSCFSSISSTSVSPLEWESGQYKPTPTIIEAAQALYRGIMSPKYLALMPMPLIKLLPMLSKIIKRQFVLLPVSPVQARPSLVLILPTGGSKWEMMSMPSFYREMDLW